MENMEMHPTTVLPTTRSSTLPMVTMMVLLVAMVLLVVLRKTQHTERAVCIRTAAIRTGAIRTTVTPAIAPTTIETAKQPDRWSILLIVLLTSITMTAVLLDVQAGTMITPPTVQQDLQ